MQVTLMLQYACCWLKEHLAENDSSYEHIDMKYLFQIFCCSFGETTEKMEFTNVTQLAAASLYSATSSCSC